MSNAPLPSSFDDDSEFYEENRWDKLLRRLKEEPLIPLGCGLTVWALLGAARSVRGGDHNKANRMFRARIYAQGFTIVAMAAGSIYWQTDRQKRKELDAVILEQKAKEKNQAWIKELEARDLEDQELKRAREARRRPKVSSGTDKTLEKGKGAVLKAVGKDTDTENKNEVLNGAVALPSEDVSQRKGVLESLQGFWSGGKK